MTRRLAMALVLFAALTVLAACAAPTPGSRASVTGTPESVTITASESLKASSLPADPPAGAPVSDGGSASSAAPDVKSIDAELKAMQKELDGLAMPDDSDFSSAESALY